MLDRRGIAITVGARVRFDSSLGARVGTVRRIGELRCGSNTSIEALCDDGDPANDDSFSNGHHVARWVGSDGIEVLIPVDARPGPALVEQQSGDLCAACGWRARFPLGPDAAIVCLVCERPALDRAAAENETRRELLADQQRAFTEAIASMQTRHEQEVETVRRRLVLWKRAARRLLDERDTLVVEGRVLAKALDRYLNDVLDVGGDDAELDHLLSSWWDTVGLAAEDCDPRTRADPTRHYDAGEVAKATGSGEVEKGPSSARTEAP
jgi:hypothetical protein